MSSLVPKLDTYINQKANVLLSGMHGVGKGLTLDTLVLTPTGKVRMGDLSIGNDVIGSNGKATKVTAIYDRGEQDVYNVIFEDGASVTTDGDHLWSVMTQKTFQFSRNTLVKSTKEMFEAGVRIERRQGWKPYYKFMIPTVRPVQYASSDLIFSPYVMGCLLANGWLENNTVAVSTNSSYISNRLDDEYGVYEQTYSGSTARKWMLKDAGPKLASLGLLGRRSKDKFIPPQYLLTDEASRRDLLAALLDCDGSAPRERKPMFFSTSPYLRDGVIELAESLGCVTKVLDDTRDKNTCYRVTISTDEELFSLPRKQGGNTGNSCVRRAIESITPAGTAVTRCIKVDADDELFVIDRHIVTHNTRVLIEAAKKHGLKVKYFSCATLDPFTDLVGIPYPVDLPSGVKTLQMVRPREIDEAEILFFDELNRSQDSKTLNAILEIIQFGSINGEVLPNLMGCWAAINPPDGEYQVHELDPALIDRFDVFHEIRPQVSVDYLEQFIDRRIAMALQEWWSDRIQTDPKCAYISPRRIEKIGRMVDDTQDYQIARAMLPPGPTYDHGKLTELLRQAMKPATTAGSSMSQGADSSIQYSASAFTSNSYATAKVLSDPAVSQTTINKAIGVLSTGISPERIIKDMSSIVEALPAPDIEAMLNGFSVPKKRTFISEWERAFLTGGVNIDKPWESSVRSPAPASGHTLTGKSFVITGRFPNHTRDTMKDLISDNGGTISNIIRNYVDYLVVGDGTSGDSKCRDAKNLMIPAMNLRQLEEAIRTGTFISTSVDQCVPTS